MNLDELKARYGEPERFLEHARAQMALHNIAKRALAREAGIDHSQLRGWFNGRVTPTLESMLRLDAALKRLI